MRSKFFVSSVRLQREQCSTLFDDNSTFVSRMQPRSVPA